MRKESIDKISFDSYLGCFGNFCMEDPVCRNFCSLNLRCVIECDQNARMEILEGLVSSDDMFIRMH